MMKQCRVCVWLACLVVVVLGGSAVAQDQPTEPIDLRSHWQQGQTSRYEFWTMIEQEAHISLGDQSDTQANTIEITGEVTWRIDRVSPDGSAEASMTLDWMNYVSEGGSAKTENDSRKPTGDVPPMHKLLQAMTGTALKVSLAPDGHVTDVKGLDAMKAKTDQPEFLPTQLDFEETASDLAALAFAPQAAVVGKPWKADFRWEHDLGHMKQAWTYELDHVEEIAGLPIAVVTGSAKLQLDVDPEQRPADAPPVDIKLADGRATNQIYYDLTRGEAVARHGTNTESVQITLNLPDGRRFSRTLNETLTSQLLRIEEQ